MLRLPRQGEPRHRGRRRPRPGPRRPRLLQRLPRRDPARRQGGRDRALLDRHLGKIACQTCHIPRFSKTQFAKMDWDWSTSGDNKTCGGTPGTCTNGVVTTKVNDEGVPDPTSATAVTSYDYIKGLFVWKLNVIPASAGRTGSPPTSGSPTRATSPTSARRPTTPPASRWASRPAAQANGKIMPFKLMRGRQAVYVDGANGFVINPNVFGPGSFWGVVQAPGLRLLDLHVRRRHGGRAGLAPQALAQGHSPRAPSPPARFPPRPRLRQVRRTNPGYAWRYTKLYMDMNHEVAPKAQALGPPRRARAPTATRHRRRSPSATCTRTRPPARAGWRKSSARRTARSMNQGPLPSRAAPFHFSLWRLTH